MTPFSRTKWWWYAALSIALLIFGRVAARAQIAVTNPPSNTQASSCYLGGGTTGSGSERVGTTVMPDGKVYAITGSYNLSVSCDGGSSCAAFSTAVQSATAEGNSISGFPQETAGASINSVAITMGPTSQGKCGPQAVACEYTTSNAAGGLTAHLYINDDPDNEELFGNATDFKGIIEHEMSHGFGIADASQNDTGLMGGSGIGTASPSPTWGNDTAVDLAIRQINTSETLAVGSCENVCNAEFPGGVATWSTGAPGYTACAAPECTNAEKARGGVPDATAPGGCKMPAGECLDSYAWNGSACVFQNSLCAASQWNVNGATVCTVLGGACLLDGGNWDSVTQTCTGVSVQQCGASGQPACATNADSCPSGLEQAPDGSCQVPGSGDCVNPSNGNDSPCSTVCGDTDPTPSWCSSVGTPSYCDNNPADPTCSNGGGGVNCALTPDDPSCPGSGAGNGSGGGGDYCSLYPDDPNCSNLCASDPSDPSCTGGGGGSGSSDGSGTCGVNLDTGDFECVL